MDTLASRASSDLLLQAETTMAVDMDTVREWLTWSFSPSLGAIVFTLLLSLSLPIIFHLFLYRQRAAVVVPSFVLLGPSGAGKTTLLTLVRLFKLHLSDTDTNSTYSSSAAHPLLPTLRKLLRPSPAIFQLALPPNRTSTALLMTPRPRRSVRSM